MKHLLLAMLALLSSTACATDEWTTPQKIGEGTYLVLVAMDWRQTMDIRNHPDFHETTSWIGSHPDNAQINRYFVVANLAQYLIADHLRSDWRDLWIGGGIILEADVVSRNKKLGLKIKFNY